MPLTNAQPTTDAELAIAAAEAGAAAVRARFGTPLDRIDKGPGDFATAADIEAESAILEVIRAARPDDGVVGEELGHRAPAIAPGWSNRCAAPSTSRPGRCWSRSTSRCGSVRE